MFGRVGKRYVNMRCPKLIQQATGLARDVECWDTIRVGDDLDLTPCYLAPPAGLEGFEKCFFRCEASSE